MNTRCCCRFIFFCFVYNTAARRKRHFLMGLVIHQVDNGNDSETSMASRLWALRWGLIRRRRHYYNNAIDLERV